MGVSFAVLLTSSSLMTPTLIVSILAVIHTVQEHSSWASVG